MPTGNGTNNFDRVRIEYFRDSTVAMEAFKAGSIDLRSENISKNWATAYDFPAVQKGLVIKGNFPHHLPTGMQGFAMNTRRPVFTDARVRQAMGLAFDFEWTNKNLFYGAYTRTTSYFSNSDLASSGVPQGDELALLEPYRSELPPELFTQPFKLPVTDGSGNNLPQLKRRWRCWSRPGWTVKERKLVNQDGQQMSFTILVDDPSLERVMLPYSRNVAKLGIDAQVRSVDPAQFQHLMDDFDFDMTFMIYPQSDVPGQELRDYWSCAAAKAQGSANVPGICDPGGGRADREGDRRQRPRVAAGRGAGAGPDAAVALVHGAELGQSGVPRRLLGPLRPSRQADPRGLQLRHLVGRPRQGSGHRRGTKGVTVGVQDRRERSAAFIVIVAKATTQAAWVHAFARMTKLRARDRCLSGSSPPAPSHAP